MGKAGIADIGGCAQGTRKQLPANSLQNPQFENYGKAWFCRPFKNLSLG